MRLLDVSIHSIEKDQSVYPVQVTYLVGRFIVGCLKFVLYFD
jgi:hypothetical protein